ncbi:MAG: DegT/DnrJ/EryC1/StrS family aminotransferase, partial [Oscillospiraceae bacterium]|nr:DegT/DnrJ/EryC1/StrS family aminotransferase [Oscillospiraceae bacterium]
METPIQKALDAYIQKDMTRFHMPGHKGADFDLLGSVLPYDLTEVLGTDSLYDAEECIRDCEREYEALYGSHRTLLSAGGSTLCIQTMLALCAPAGSKILAGRNIHVAAVNAMGLLDLRPTWILPKPNPGGVGSTISPADVENALSADPELRAVYITSPDYFGVMSDVGAIAEICKHHHVPLLVDNAHGAHFPFLEENRHPMALGAAACCDSLHKTLPVLTGGALLHLADETMASG